jgi:hypothetical protein
MSVDAARQPDPRVLYTGEAKVMVGLSITQIRTLLHAEDMAHELGNPRDPILVDKLETALAMMTDEPFVRFADLAEDDTPTHLED